MARYFLDILSRARYFLVLYFTRQVFWVPSSLQTRAMFPQCPTYSQIAGIRPSTQAYKASDRIFKIISQPLKYFSSTTLTATIVLLKNKTIISEYLVYYASVFSTVCRNLSVFVLSLGPQVLLNAMLQSQGNRDTQLFL